MSTPDEQSPVGPDLGFGIAVTGPRRFVYILKSISAPAQYYIGVTSDPKTRLQAHNSGLSPHTAAHRPWRTLVVIEFDEEEPARTFERRPVPVGSLPGVTFARQLDRNARVVSAVLVDQPAAAAIGTTNS